MNALSSELTTVENWLNAIALPAMVVDASLPDRPIQFANWAWLSAHGHGVSPLSASGQFFLTTFYHTTPTEQLITTLNDVLSHPKSCRTISVRSSHGPKERGRWYRHTLCGVESELLNPDARLILIVEQDITWEVLDESRLAQQASIDPLTGLLAREPFLNELRRKLSGLTTSQGSLCLVFIDLNKFKPINDEYGHDAGDRVLSQIGERLLTEMSHGNLAGRLGGDEFVLLLSGTLDEDAIADYLHTMVERVFQPVQINASLSLPIGGSFGYACTQDPHVSEAELLKAADQAMYRAKQNPNEGLVVAGEVVESSEKSFSRTELLRALKTEGLEMHLHPIGSRIHNQIVGFEVVPRWQHPDYGLLELEHFHPLLVHSEEGKAFDRWLILTAAELSASFQNRGFHLGIGINLTRRQLDSGSFVESMREAIPYFSDGRVDLTLEIIESPHFRDHDLAFSALQQAREMGAQVVLDDFGSETSSMVFAHKVPLDFIKLHESLSHDLRNHPDRRRYVAALIAFSHELGARVVASGVDDEDDAGILTGLNCDLIQGKLWLDPMTVSEVKDAFLGDYVDGKFRLRSKA